MIVGRKAVVIDLCLLDKCIFLFPSIPFFELMKSRLSMQHRKICECNQLKEEKRSVFDHKSRVKNACTKILLAEGTRLGPG